MYEFFEQGIRGGMTFVNKHHLEADDETSIAYWDENNLYGGALRQRLPCGDFSWVEPRDFERMDLLNIDRGRYWVHFESRFGVSTGGT